VFEKWQRRVLRLSSRTEHHERGSWPNDAGRPFHEHVQQIGGARSLAFPLLTSFGHDLDTISLPPPASIDVTGLIIYS
jgi:hypothetical protein